MTVQVRCTACGWTNNEEPPQQRCPLCKRPTQQAITLEDALREYSIKFAVGLLLASAALLLWICLTYPFQWGSDPPAATLRLIPAKLSDSPDGAVVQLRIANDSPHKFATLLFDTKFYLRNRGKGTVGVNEQQLAVANVRPRTDNKIEIVLPDCQAEDLERWSAEIKSFELPRGYWSRRLQSAMSVRLLGLSHSYPIGFDPSVRAAPKQKPAPAQPPPAAE